MSKRISLPIWREIPFLRIIIPLIIGITIQDASRFSIISCYYSFISTQLIFVLYSLLPVNSRFKFRYWKGCTLFISLLCIGVFITSLQQPALKKSWIGRYIKSNAVICVQVLAAPIEKERSFKIATRATRLFLDSIQIELNDLVTVYLEKDSLPPDIHIGSLIYFNKSLQEIKGTGNPGSFDFRRYSELQQCFYQVYLPKKSYFINNTSNLKWLQFLQSTREWLVGIIRKYIPSKKEAGLAEALLIAYKDDLDKSLVQSYANTGVVHIIAISGLHLGLVYWLLATLLNPIANATKMKWIKPLGVIAGLWLFSLLAGASPSVLRSAVMFSFLVAGELFGKKTNAINNLAASAFLLLCFNPFWLWDAGFQLSYAAVLSLLVFMKPVYQLIEIKNKWLDLLWKMNAVTLSAQILTIPICIFYFHQFPNAFLITNLIAVPLSSCILFLEIGLCAIAAFNSIAHFLGQILQWLLFAMNYFIENMSRLPFAVWEHLYISLYQTLLLYAFIICLSVWLFTKLKTAFFAAIIILCVFFSVRSVHMIDTSRQNKLVIYNLAKKQAVDLILGNRHIYYGDSSANNSSNSSMSPLYLNRLQLNALTPYNYELKAGLLYKINNSSILIYNSEFDIIPGTEKPKANFLIISNNPLSSPNEVLSQIETGYIVLDASNNYKTVAKWRKEAANLGIACHSVVDNGAFVINLP